MPQLKEGGVLYTVTDKNGNNRVLNYIPEATIKPSLLDIVVDNSKPTAVLKNVGEALDYLGAKMTGPMSNYGVDEGDEGRQKWTDRGHTVMSWAKKIPIVKPAAEGFDLLLTATEVAADIEKGNNTTATTRAVSYVAGEMINKAIGAALPDGDGLKGKVTKEAVKYGVKKGVQEVKDAMMDEAKKVDDSKRK